MLLSAPCVGQFQEFRQAVERANLMTEINVTTIYDASNINPHYIKSVTDDVGNDAESAQVFYTQNMSCKKFKSLIYGATNKIIVFKGCEKKMYNIKSLYPIHAITLH